MKKLRDLGLATALGAGVLAGANAKADDYVLNGSPIELYGAIFADASHQPSGNGVFGTFLTMQHRGNESGYNSPLVLQYDTKMEQTRETLFGEYNQSSGYLQFGVDGNEVQSGNNSTLTLDDFRVYTSSAPITSPVSSLSELGTERYSLGNNTITFDTAGNGSGISDLSIRVPLSNFSGVSLDDYVTVYASFNRASDGPEEIGAMLNHQIPEPSAFALAGLGAAALLARRKR